MADAHSSLENFSEDGFWSKVRRYALAAGRDVIFKGLCMYYAYRDEKTPVWAKTVIAGALGYFILPLDTVPDVLPAIGYTDDLVALAVASATVASHVNEKHRHQANQKLGEWFGA